MEFTDNVLGGVLKTDIRRFRSVTLLPLH